MYKIGQKVWYQFRSGAYYGDLGKSRREGVITDIDNKYIYAMFPDSAGGRDRPVRFDLNGDGIGYDSLDVTRFNGTDPGSKLVHVSDQETDLKAAAQAVREAYAIIAVNEKILTDAGYEILRDYPNDGEVSIEKTIKL